MALPCIPKCPVKVCSTHYKAKNKAVVNVPAVVCREKESPNAALEMGTAASLVGDFISPQSSKFLNVK